MTQEKPKWKLKSTPRNNKKTANQSGKDSQVVMVKVDKYSSVKIIFIHSKTVLHTEPFCLFWVACT